MRLRGVVCKETLTAAFATAVKRHPLLSSVVVETTEGPAWRPQRCLPELNWTAGDQPTANAAVLRAPAAINLREESGLRVQLMNHSDSLTALIDFHHATCDGQAARQLLADWFHTYDHKCRNQTPQLTTFEQEKLQSRGIIRTRPGVEPIGFKEGLRNFWVTVSGRTARLPQKRTATAADDAGRSRLTERVLTADQTATLRRRLKDAGLSINDLGIAASLKVFATTFPRVNSKHFVTVLNPVDLRLPSDRYLSAANKTGFTYLRRRHRDCQALGPLLKSVRDETTYIKNRFVGAEFIHGLASVDRRPWLLSLIRRAGLFTPTLQFTCLGDATRGRRYGFRQEDGVVTLGDLRLESISGFAPIAPGVPLSITASETSNRLSLTVHYHLRFLTPEQGEAFTDALVHELLNWS